MNEILEVCEQPLKTAEALLEKLAMNFELDPMLLTHLLQLVKKFFYRAVSKIKFYDVKTKEIFDNVQAKFNNLSEIHGFYKQENMFQFYCI